MHLETAQGSWIALAAISSILWGYCDLGTKQALCGKLLLMVFESRQRRPPMAQQYIDHRLQNSTISMQKRKLLS